jgi:energy-coupling factor transport system substrate-specific component
VSWELAAFLLLGLALVAGFTWYERSRPDARVVALVGTLAAFAALGRIAFAAVPNVKPTTDIVFIAGFALGGGPGFAVGAIAGLTSNFFFGQGPWTPWQMAAWGATGVLGAALARATHGRLGRWPLAIVCGAAGFAFTAVQDAGNWAIYTDHSLAQLGAFVGTGLGFDAVHAAGCVVFALAFGPALIRSVTRFARRLEVTWIPPAAAPLLLIAAACGVALAAGAAAPPPAHADEAHASSSIRAAAGYLRRAQNADGGLGAAPGQRSDPLFAGWGALGLVSAGDDVASMRTALGRPTLLDYVEHGAGSNDVGSVERTILVARATGADPSAFGGHDLVAALRRHISRDGAVDAEVNLTAFGLLALRASGAAPALQHRAAAWLVRAADRDGGYGIEPRGDSDADDTGAVLEALGGERVHGSPRARRRAIAWLRRHQDGDGGFPAEGDSGSNAQSTAWAVQGLIAAGVDPATVRRAGHTPLDYLRSLVTSDGAVRYARGQTQTPVWVTGEALMALAGKPLPLVAASPQRPATATAATTTATATTTSSTTPTVFHPTSRPPRRHAPPRNRAVSRAVARMAHAVTALPAVIVSAARIGP